VSKPDKVRIPVYLYVLDFAGMLLVGIGLLLKFAPQNADIIPASMPLRNDPNLLIIIGLAMFIPLIKFMLKLAAAQKPPKNS